MNKKSIYFFDIFNSFGGAQKSSSTLINYLHSECQDSVVVQFLSIEKQHSAYEKLLECKILSLNIDSAKNLYHTKRRFFRAIRPSIQLIVRLAKSLKSVASKQNEPVTVVTSSLKGLTYLAVSKLICRGDFRIIYYCRGDGNIKNSLVRLIFKFDLLYKVLAVSSRTKQGLLGCGVRGSKIAVVYTSVNAQEIAEKAESKLEPMLNFNSTVQTKKLLYAASIIEMKGLDVLLKALLGTPWDDPKNVLLIAGCTPSGKSYQYEQDCRVLAGKLRMRTCWLGWRNDVPRLIRESDSVCLPSLSEGFPRIVQEAMYLKRQVIATDVGGTLELLNDGKLGFVAKPSSVSSLRRCLDNAFSLHHKPEELKVKLDKAQEYFLSSFEVSNQHKIFLEAICD